MIRDSLDNLMRYGFITVHMQKIYDFLLSANDKPCGKYDIAEDIFVFVQDFSTKENDDFHYEEHDKYMDIQLLLQGEECLYYSPQNNLKIDQPFTDGNDIMFYYPQSLNYLEKSILKPNDFVIYFPNEPHAPGHKHISSAKCKKAVVKIKLK